MKISYYAVFFFFCDGICISFSAVPPALTCADNETDGVRYAKEVLELALHGMSIDEIPQPSAANQIAITENQKLFGITVELTVKTGKLFGKNIIDFE